MSLEYKGYVSGPISYDDGVFSATVEGLRDVVHFEAQTAEEMEQAFKESIDDYLAMCAQDGVDPDRSYSGQFMIRTDSTVHRNAAMYAAAEGKSLNQWVSEVLVAGLTKSDFQNIRRKATRSSSTGRFEEAREKPRKPSVHTG